MNYLRDYKIPKRLEPLAVDVFKLYYSYMEKVLPINITQHKKDLMWKATKCFVLNMAYHCHKDNNRFPIVYREAYYTRSLIYNGRPVNRKISRTYTLALFDALAHYGLAEFEKGGVETWNVDFDTGELTPASMSSSFCVLGDELFERVLSINNHEDVKVRKNVILVKNKDKKIVSKTLDDYTRKLVTDMVGWNTKLFNSEIELDDEIYEVQLHKVFNNSSFKRGGRTYVSGSGGSMNLLKRVSRGRMKIDGKPTIEIDYKCLNPSIIAEMSMGDDIDPDFDAYAIRLDGYDSDAVRELAKYAFMMLVGCKTKRGAIQALRNRIRDDKKLGKASDINRHQEEGKLPETIDCTAIIDAVFERNTYAGEWFFSENAVELQNIDSRIIDYCMNWFIQNDKFILPVHDSIIVMKEDLDEGQRIMREAYKYVMGSDKHCKLKIVDYCEEN